MSVNSKENNMLQISVQVTRKMQDNLTSPESILSLPNEVLEKIFNYLPYKDIGKIRLVCKRFDFVSSMMLNTEYHRLQMLILEKYLTIRFPLPRRLSIGKKIPLIHENAVIKILHSRFLMLQRLLDDEAGCFFAGEILDEVRRILYNLKIKSSSSSAYDVTDYFVNLCLTVEKHCNDYNDMKELIKWADFTVDDVKSTIIPIPEIKFESRYPPILDIKYCRCSLPCITICIILTGICVYILSVYFMCEQ